ncbi:MAG: DNA primase [Patescibacteria group bacterium]
MSDIEEIKSRLNIADIIGRRIPLKKAGRNFKALCPFHSEKTPSFIVSPERQIFHCFGCGAGGSIFDFVMAYDRVDFAEALQDLADLAGVKLTPRTFAAPQDKLKQRLLEVNHLASEFYHYLLTQHQLGHACRAYLKGRGISDKSVKTFALGYSPNSWDGLLKFLRKKGYEEELMEKAGLVVRGPGGSFYDLFRGRVMFTLKNHRGDIVGFSGRILDEEVHPEQSRGAKYINSPETPVYVKSNILYGLDVTRSNIQKENEAVVVEGEFDVISSFQAGIGNVVAIKGSALTEGHVRLLRRYTEKLTLALDSDVAGDAAARRGIEIADSVGLDIKVAVLSQGKDPDEAARENPGLLKKTLKEAVPVYDYFIASAVARYGTTTAFGKKKIGEELLPVLTKIENPIVQGHYVKKLARTLEVEEETIAEGLRRVSRALLRHPREEVTLPKEESPVSRQEKLETYLLALILQGHRHQEWLAQLKDKVQFSDFSLRAVAQILSRLEEFLAKNKAAFSAKDFADTLPKELAAIFDHAYLWDTSPFIEDEDEVYRQWQKALWELQRLLLRRQIKSLTERADQEERQKELKELTDKLKSLEKSS